MTDDEKAKAVVSAWTVCCECGGGPDWCYRLYCTPSVKFLALIHDNSGQLYCVQCAAGMWPDLTNPNHMEVVVRRYIGTETAEELWRIIRCGPDIKVGHNGAVIYDD